MPDDRFIKLIENIGYVNECGKHIYGTAALLHIVHCPVKNIKPEHVEIGKTYVEKYLSV